MNEKRFSSMGKWTSEYDKDGKCTSVTYDKEFLGLLEIKTIDATDSEKHWRKIIHPDDFQMIYKVYENLFSKHSKVMDYDMECRLLVGKEYHWFHDFVYCTRRQDGSVSRIDGVLFDIQDIVDGQEAQKTFAQNNIRFFALEDNFESLYDVELESGHYVSYSRGDFYKTNISDKLVSPVQFFENMRENVDRVVYKDDKELTFKVQQREEIRKELSESDYFDHYYRVITDKGPVWFKMRIVYKDDEKKNVIIGVFNAAEEMAAKEKESLNCIKILNFSFVMSGFAKKSLVI